jgi:hypothetical protein
VQCEMDRVVVGEYVKKEKCEDESVDSKLG